MFAAHKSLAGNLLSSQRIVVKGGHEGRLPAYAGGWMQGRVHAHMDRFDAKDGLDSQCEEPWRKV